MMMMRRWSWSWSRVGEADGYEEWCPTWAANNQLGHHFTYLMRVHNAILTTMCIILHYITLQPNQSISPLLFLHLISSAPCAVKWRRCVVLMVVWALFYLKRKSWSFKRINHHHYKHASCSQMQRHDFKQKSTHPSWFTVYIYMHFNVVAYKVAYSLSLFKSHKSHKCFTYVLLHRN